MKVLVCNDDGITSPGLVFMASCLAKEGYDVRVSAPETNQSAVSAKVCLHGSLHATRSAPGTIPGVTWAVAVRGTPIDALRVGLHLCGSSWVPDIVCSGVNHGNNLACCHVYSGTVAVATEAIILGLPRSIAFSYDLRSYTEFTDADSDGMRAVIEAVVPRVVGDAFKFGLPSGNTLLVNLPNSLSASPSVNNPRMRPTKTAVAQLLTSYSPEPEEFFRTSAAGQPMEIRVNPATLNVPSSPPPSDGELMTDVQAVEEGCVSVCPFPVARDSGLGSDVIAALLKWPMFADK